MLTLVDQDAFSESNLNRQLGALHSTLGQPKAEVTARRLLDISPGCRLRPLVGTYAAGERERFWDSYDYVVDAIDLVSCKIDSDLYGFGPGNPHHLRPGDRQQAGPHPAAGDGPRQDQRAVPWPGCCAGSWGGWASGT